MAKKKKAAKKKSAKKKATKSHSTRSAADRSTPTDTQVGPETIPITPTPTAGKKMEDFEKALDEAIGAEEIDQEINQISDPAKKPLGRPRKIDTKPAPALTQKANPLWPPVLKIPFDGWAENQKIDELRITDKEAELLALPITQLIDYYLPHLPEIAIAWLGLISAGYSILGPRLQIIKSRRQTKAGPGPSPNPPQGGGPIVQPAGFPNEDQITQTEKI